jgi:drug/metabolite transporter (DMT)-like permease
MRTPGYGAAMLAVTVLTWASAFPLITIGLRGLGPAALGEARLVGAALALAAVAIVVRPRLPPRKHWLRIVAAGLLGQTLYQALLMSGEVEVPAGTASLLIATAPLFSLLGAVVLLHDTSRGRRTGMLVSFVGAALVGASTGTGGGKFALLVLAAAACQGFYHVVLKPLAESLGAFAATSWSVWAGALMGVPALPGLLRELPHLSTQAAGAAVLLGVVPSTIGFLAWSAAVARVPIAQSTVALYLIPVVAMALSWVLLDERPPAMALLGGALAVGGVVLVRRPRARCRPTYPSDQREPMPGRTIWPGATRRHDVHVG